MLQKIGMGWLPDYPEVRDSTPTHDKILPLLSRANVSGTRQAGVPGADPTRLPWAEVIANDPLLRAPPKVWDDVSTAAMHHSALWDLIFRPLS